MEAQPAFFALGLPGSGVLGGSGPAVFGVLILAAVVWEIFRHNNVRQWTVWTLPVAAACFFFAETLHASSAFALGLLGLLVLVPHVLFVIREHQNNRR